MSCPGPSHTRRRPCSLWCLRTLAVVVLLFGSGAALSGHTEQRLRRRSDEAESVAAPHQDRGIDAHAPPGPNDPHFMILLSSGCSGSSWVWATIVKIIQAHRRNNASSTLPVLLGAVDRSMGGADAMKEWLEPRFCTPKESDDSVAVQTVPSVCGHGMVVQCEQAVRLGDAWSGMRGGCGHAADPSLTPGASSEKDAKTPGYVMPMSALYNQVEPSGWLTLTPQTTRVAASVKRNAFDQLLCNIRDCFDPVAGIPVNPEGQRRTECFNRRGGGSRPLTDAEYKAKVDPALVLQKLDNLVGANKQAAMWWRQPNFLDRGEGFNNPYHHPETDGLPRGFGKPTNSMPDAGEYYEASVEDLTGFEFTTEDSDDAWGVSLDSWEALMVSLGAPANRSIIKSVLKGEMRGRRPRRHHSHTEVVYNADEIRSILKTSRYAWMWRD
eukprot:m.193744 g.193744  ORF g.193744 m.193744 type:complete len:439 (+) comp19012_c0_seq1:204-1520(+)